MYPAWESGVYLHKRIMVHGHRTFAKHACPLNCREHARHPATVAAISLAPCALKPPTPPGLTYNVTGYPDDLTLLRLTASGAGSPVTGTNEVKRAQGCTHVARSGRAGN